MDFPTTTNNTLLRGALLAFALAGCSGNGIAVVCSPACAPGFHCESGACVSDGNQPDGGGGGDLGQTCSPVCGGLTPHCNSAGHCVACVDDTQCPDGSYCKVTSATSASCAVGCMTADHCGGAKQCCAMQCADTSDDARNCGGCGMSCTAPHAQSTCVASQCQTGTCDIGWDDCNGNAKDGCETNLHVDPANCGMCGNACALSNAISGCSDGCYIAACNFGWDDCNTTTDDGCETTVLADPSNCGACGAVCMGLPNASANCTAGNCVLGTCSQNFADCDGDPGNGCEVGLQFDKMNCGKCGFACPMNTPFCVGGTCGQVGNRVLLLYADSIQYATDVQTNLKATNAFTAVDLMAGTAMTPTLAMLQPYDAVLVWSNNGFLDPAGTGNVLASYFDQGGRVVVATFANASVAVTGAWTARQLIQPGGQEEPTDSLGKINEMNSPLVNGVTKLTATAAYRSTGGAINGGIVVAAWNSGKPLIVRGVLNGHNYVSLNLFPPSSGNGTGRNDFWVGDGAAIMRNALLFE